jgi:hypothetical protein
MERDVLGDKRCRAFSLVLLLALIAGVTMTHPNLWASEASPGSHRRMASSLSNQGENEAAEEDDENDFMEDLLGESSGAGDTATAPAVDRKNFPVDYEGELVAHLWAPNDYDHDWHTTDRLDLKGWGDIGAIRMAGRFRLDYQDLEKDAKARSDLRELYATYQLRPTASSYADITIGKKILYWGKGDEVRPIDRVCPEDLNALYFYNLNDRKTGRIGTFLDVQFTRQLRFEGFWSPYFEASQTPESGDYYEPALLRQLTDAGIGIDGEDEPDEWSADAGLGGRLMFSLFKADLALYAFHGYDPKPSYGVHRLGPDPYFGLPIVPQSINATYPRMTLFGADVERTLGAVVLRAEAAYQSRGAWFALDWQQDPTLLLETPRGNVEKDQLQYVVGMDKNDLFIRNLFFNLQLLGSHIFDHDPRMVASESQTGMTAYLRYACLDSKLELWYRYMLIFQDEDQRHHFEMTYKPLPWAQVGIGAVAFDGGGDTTTFGQYADRDFVYAKLKLIF